MRHPKCTPMKGVTKSQLPQKPPRVSWWLQAPRDRFTELAADNVQPEPTNQKERIAREW